MTSAAAPPNPPPTPDDVNAVVAVSFPGSRNRCTAIGSTWAEAEVEATPENIRPGGFISGPTQFGLADSALWYAVFGAIGIEPMALTSEMSIRFLRPAVGDVLRGRADLHQVGRRNIVGTVTIWADDRRDRPVAVAQGTYARPVP